MKPIIGLAALALLAAACGGSPSSPGPGGSSTAGGPADSQLLAFAHCVRSHGVPDFPDPSGNGKFPTAQQLGVGSSQYQAAQNACQRLLPSGTDDQFPPAEVPLLLSGMRQFSQCMRSHGVPDWPDPTTDSQGRPVFDLGRAGITQGEARSSQITTKVSQCQHLLPPNLGGIPIGGS
jgi:hypothetical protein